MKSKNSKKNVAAKRVSLEIVLNQSEKIKETVEQAANDLTEVNEVLKQGNTVNVPVQIIQDIITQNEDVEHTVAQAADDLEQVNTELAKEVTEREVIETELAETKLILAAVREDLSQSQANEEEARNSALQDPLTCLPNRVSFEQVLEHGLLQAKRHGRGLAVLFIDIDNFKSINDSNGHDGGDKVLQMVAECLQSSVRKGDTVCRWGGDEFVCVLLEVKQEADVMRIAENIVNRIAEAWEFNGSVFSINVSIGIALYPADGQTADILIKKADTAMYIAKGTEQRINRS